MMRVAWLLIALLCATAAQAHKPSDSYLRSEEHTSELQSH